MTSHRGTTASVEEILTDIRAAGGRVTVPTRIVVEILAAGDHHLSADDLIAEFAERTPGVAPSTIYRVLQRLDQLQVVEHVHSGMGPTFYHLRDRGHAHLVCESCGAITDLPDGVLEPVSTAVAADFGFTVRTHHAALLGRCAACAADDKRSSS
ncbi:MAG: Fur family transcriptional regulator [Ilumatobacteraceae bacterium]